MFYPLICRDAARERDLYKFQCVESKAATAAQLESGVRRGEADLNCQDIAHHYSVDIIQNTLLILQTFSQQPGKLDFKTGRKVNLLKLIACNEGRPHGCMYIIDEARMTGKGAEWWSHLHATWLCQSVALWGEDYEMPCW